MFVSRETLKARELLSRGLEEICLEADEKRVEILSRYAYLIFRYNQKARLVGYRAIEEIVNFLILDSLLFFLTGVALNNQKGVDIGAGAGIPSLPLKIFFSDWDLDLVEPAAKKAAFLRKVQLELKIEKTRVFQRKLEELEMEGISSPYYTIAFSRAFGNFTLLLRFLKPFLRSGGLVVLYQGKDTSQALKKVFKNGNREGYLLLDQKKFGFSFLPHPRFISILRRV